MNSRIYHLYEGLERDKVEVRLLQILADHLKTVPKENFNMRTWWCGTAGCAMGHACNIPEFQQAGLYLLQSNKVPVYRSDGYEHGGIYAPMWLFKITYEVASHLFFFGSYGNPDAGLGTKVTSQDVATRIEQFIKDVKSQCKHGQDMPGFCVACAHEDKALGKVW